MQTRGSIDPDAIEETPDLRSPFVSRADDSGTHQKEKSVWTACETRPDGDWYLKAGTGMAQALRLAGEKHAYVLTDRGTYLALRDELGPGPDLRGRSGPGEPVPRHHRETRGPPPVESGGRSGVSSST